MLKCSLWSHWSKVYVFFVQFNIRTQVLEVSNVKVFVLPQSYSKGYIFVTQAEQNNSRSGERSKTGPYQQDERRGGQQGEETHRWKSDWWIQISCNARAHGHRRWVQRWRHRCGHRLWRSSFGEKRAPTGLYWRRRGRRGSEIWARLRRSLAWRLPWRTLPGKDDRWDSMLSRLYRTGSWTSLLLLLLRQKSVYREKDAVKEEKLFVWFGLVSLWRDVDGLL